MSEKEKEIYHNLLRSAQIAANAFDAELYDKVFEVLRWMQERSGEQMIGGKS